MKFIASSFYLKRKLKEIKFKDGEHVAYVVFEEQNVKLVTNRNKTIHLSVVSNKGLYQKRIDQTNRRWDFILQILLFADDQPVIIEVHEKAVSLIFQY